LQRLECGKWAHLHITLKDGRVITEDGCNYGEVDMKWASAEHFYDKNYNEVAQLIEVMHIDQIRNWFGDRGYPFYDNSKLRYKVINIKGSRWIFSTTRKTYDDEVELYYMNTIYCEPFDMWPRKGFQLGKKEFN
jgi:hypothetical protein